MGRRGQGRCGRLCGSRGCWKVDQLLSDEELVGQGVRRRKGICTRRRRTRGRWQTPADTVLSLGCCWKHVRAGKLELMTCWSREVRANPGCIGTSRALDWGKVLDAKTLARIGQAIGGEVVAELHRRLVEIGLQKGVVAGRKMRVTRRWWRAIFIIRPTRPRC